MSESTVTNNREGKEMTRPAKSLNIAIQIILLFVTVYIIVRTVNAVGISLFTWHPVLVSLGYLLIMSHAILCMADNNFLTHSLNYQQRVTVHWVLQASALVLITIAQTCIFLNKNRLGKSHYQTTHAIFGLITYLLTLGAIFGGIFTKYSFQFRNTVKPVVSKIVHSFAGLVTYCMAVITVCLGIHQFFNDSHDSWSKPIVYIVLFLTTLYVTIKSIILLSTRTSNVLKRSNM